MHATELGLSPSSPPQQRGGETQELGGSEMRCCLRVTCPNESSSVSSTWP